MNAGFYDNIGNARGDNNANVYFVQKSAYILGGIMVCFTV